jgi:hypothetical protein
VAREMTIYVGGVEMTLVWRDEAEYQRARKFLTDKGALIAPWVNNGAQNAEYICLEDKDEIKALIDHVRSPHQRSDS